MNKKKANHIPQQQKSLQQQYEIYKRYFHSRPSFMFSWIDYDLKVHASNTWLNRTLQNVFLSLARCYDRIESNRFDKPIHAERIGFQRIVKRSIEREKKTK